MNKPATSTLKEKDQEKQPKLANMENQNKKREKGNLQGEKNKTYTNYKPEKKGEKVNTGSP